MRLQTIIVGIAVALCLGDRPGFAVGDACGLSYAKANELMALSDASTLGNWIPPRGRLRF